jgi:hypothetical protein
LRRAIGKSFWLFAVGLFLVVPGSGFAEEVWPIAFLDVATLAPGIPPEKTDQPETSQPEFFDPSHYKSVKDIPEESNFVSVTTQWTDSRPYTLKEYYFDTDDEPSYVLEINEGSARHALYTQVNQYKFSPNHKKLLIDNQIKLPEGKWQSLNRIIDVASKQAVELQNYECTRFYEATSDTHVITYGLGTKKGDDSFGPPRVVCMWDMRGKLEQALSVPLQNTLANTEASPNLFGLLPREESTFYQLAYASEHCVLRLQNLTIRGEHRQIQLPSGFVTKDSQEALASGDIGDPCEDGVAVEIDLNKLKLAGGNVRFRISKSGRGDLDNDWTEWKTYQ